VRRLTPYALLAVLMLGMGLGIGLGLGLGLAPSAASLITIRISLSETRVPSGTPIKGEVVVTNTTSKPITVQVFNGCELDSLLEVGLTNKRIAFEASSDLAGCSRPIRLSPGPHRIPLTVATSYQSCLQKGGQSTTYMPLCTPTGQPALPAGHYMTKVLTAFGPSLGTQPTTPISVTLLPTRG
jgi:hypothetical protein